MLLGDGGQRARSWTTFRQLLRITFSEREGIHFTRNSRRSSCNYVTIKFLSNESERS